MSKISRYNHFQQWQGGYRIAFNAFTGALALMTEDNFQTYQKLAAKLSNGNSAPILTDAERELLQQLEHGRFVHPNDCNELQALKFTHGSARFDRTALALIVAPTLACNMACPYCFENNKRGKMTPEIADQIGEFVSRQAKTLTQLDLTWYGGEPLLAMDVIEKLSQRFIRLGSEQQFTYRASIITNGYLLDRDTVDTLVDLKVGVCQVTLDGPARLHNVRRPLKNGKESFRTIVDNLKYAAGKLVLSVRVNIDRSIRSADVAELLAELKAAGLQQRISVNFGMIEPSSATCAAVAEACYEIADFSQVEIDFYRQLLDNGYRVEKLPSPCAVFCMAQLVNAFLVDPDGNLYRCWNYVGDPAKTMGHIRDKIDYQNANFVNLFAVDPFADPLCCDCDLLPVCMGGCPSNRADRGLTGEQACQSWKHNLSPMLEIIARSRSQRAAPIPKEQS